MLKSILKTSIYIACLAWSGIACAAGLGGINVTSSFPRNAAGMQALHLLYHAVIEAIPQASGYSLAQRFPLPVNADNR